MSRLEFAVRFRFTAVILPFVPISARTVFLKIRTAAAPPTAVPPPDKVPAVILIVAISSARTVKSPFKMIFTLLPIRAAESALAMIRIRDPPTAVLPPVAAATTPVIVSLDCAFTFREPAWMDVSSSTSALVWLLKMMLAPAPPTATAPPDTDAAPEVMYCQLMAFTLTAAVPVSMVPPSWLVTVFSV